MPIKNDKLLFGTANKSWISHNKPGEHRDGNSCGFGRHRHVVAHLPLTAARAPETDRDPRAVRG